MKLAIVGATGGTGQELTELAIDTGHEVRALTRSPHKLSHGEVTIVEGNVLDEDDVRTTVDGTDAVVCLLGKTPGNPEDVVSRGTANIVEVMEEGVSDRLVVLTSMGLGSSIRQVPWYVRIANATLLTELMADKARQEEIVMASDLDWTIVRPGGLTDGSRTDQYLHGADINATAGPISRADVAAFILRIIEHDSYVRETPNITTENDIDAAFLWDQVTGVTKRLMADS